MKRQGPIILPSEAVKVKYKSITRFVLDGTGACETITVVQVWRTEKTSGPYHLANMDLEVEARKYHPTFYDVIAKALIEMDRVVKVEVVCQFSGSGIEIERE